MTAARTRGMCYGFDVRSTLPLRFLRHGMAADVLEVGYQPQRRSDEGRAAGDPRLTWSPPDHPFRARLHGGPTRYQLWIERSGTFAVDTAAPKILVPHREWPIRREERLWGLPSVLCFSARGDTPLHAATVEVDGRALVLAAPGRHGKTTLAAAFGRAGHRVLAEDVTCIRDGVVPAVLPGPGMLRLRHDSAAAMGTSWAEEVGSDADRVHLALPDPLVGNGDPVPLAAVILLRGDASHLRMSAADGPQALSDLWSLSFHLAEDATRSRRFASLVELLASVPVIDLVRPLRFDELERTAERIVDIIGGFRVSSGRWGR